jgi:group I intron endonuclease
MGYIYKITNTVSGKSYIGETKEEDVERRWKQHKNTIKHGRGCPALQDAVRKYGWDAFKFEIVVICFDENRYDMEQHYIKKYNTLVPNGYNITLGGVGGGFIGKKHTPETLAKIKESLAKFKEANPNHIDTYREKLSNSLKKLNIGERLKNSEKWQAAVKEGRVGGGAHKNAEKKAEIYKKVSETLKKYYKENNGNAYINTEKHRAKMSKAVGKSIHKIENGNIIKTYDSISEAARKNEIPSSTLCRAVKLNKELKGFVWQLATQDTT